MSILWCGGEDIDFVDTVTIVASNNRAGYARHGLYTSGATFSKSLVFPGGAISSGWCSARVGSAGLSANKEYFGLVNTSQGKGIFAGCTTQGKAALYKYDGGFTSLQAESGTSLDFTVQKLDINLIALGASGHVVVYAGGTQVISYTGDLSWLSSPDCVAIVGAQTSNTVLSELIVADEDTRLFSLVTMAPNAAGDSNAWTGAYTDINDTTINDATVLYTNTTAQDALFNLIDLPSGSFTIRAVRVAARAAKSSVATAGSISLGVKSGGTVNVDTAHACSSAFATIDRLMTQNPVTSNNWLQSEMNGLQVAFRSAT